MKKVLFYILILVLSFTLMGCAKNEVVIKPSKLFEGDTEKIGAHLDMITGCIHLKYNGEKNIRTKYEIWENGELKESGDGISVTADSYGKEISISIKDDIKTNTMKMKLMVEYKEGYAGITKHIEGVNLFNTNEEYWGFAPVEMQDTIYASDDDEIAVWGVTASKGKYNAPKETSPIDEEVRGAEWGLVLKLYFE